MLSAYPGSQFLIGNDTTNVSARCARAIEPAYEVEHDPQRSGRREIIALISTVSGSDRGFR
jgi:hypothetical protein